MIKEITIVGGGSAAWMTAAFFNYNLKQYKLTVIDKETPSPIGVGEGTLLNFIDFMFQCGLEFKDWFPDVDATLKSGILFPDWREEAIMSGIHSQILLTLGLMKKATLGLMSGVPGQ